MIAVLAVMYFVQSGFVQLVDWFVMKKAAAVIILDGTKVFVDVEAPTADNNVTFRLRSDRLSVESKKSVGEFFYEAGTLSELAVWTEFNLLRTRYLKELKMAGSKKD